MIATLITTESNINSNRDIHRSKSIRNTLGVSESVVDETSSDV